MKRGSACHGDYALRAVIVVQAIQRVLDLDILEAVLRFQGFPKFIGALGNFRDFFVLIVQHVGDVVP